MDSAAATTTDAFLGGRVLAVQPARGHHRSGLEAVLLAASVPAEATGLALDLGAGAGVAGLCLAARCAGVRVGLVERDPDLVALAERSRALPDNRALHGRVLPMALDINAAEAERAAAGLVRAGADIVLCNPPFHTAGRVRVSPAAARADAHVLADGLDPWLRFAAWALRPGGELVLTLAATSLPELFPALAGRFGGAAILPIHPRPGAAAHRLLVRAVRARRSAPSILPGLVLHGDAGSAFTAPVAALLRGEADLATTHPAWRQSP